MDFLTRPCDRRFVLRASLFTLAMLGLSRCNRSYVRPGEVLDLGNATDLLSPKQHLRNVAILLFRDERGWAALSSRCSYDGCDLTFQEQSLFCSCCKSRFTHEGRIIHGPATLILPWYEMYFENGNLYANSGKRVPPEYRFIEQSLEASIAERRKQIAEKGVLEAVKIPEELKGGRNSIEGPMFKDFEQDQLDDLYRVPESTTTTTLQATE